MHLPTHMLSAVCKGRTERVLFVRICSIHLQDSCSACVVQNFWFWYRTVYTASCRCVCVCLHCAAVLIRLLLCVCVFACVFRCGCSGTCCSFYASIDSKVQTLFATTVAGAQLQQQQLQGRMQELARRYYKARRNVKDTENKQTVLWNALRQFQANCSKRVVWKLKLHVQHTYRLASLTHI